MNIPRRNLLIGIFVASFLLRAVLLWHPPKHYFDEVYFAYNAQEMSKGNVEAWKVSTQAPQGFAFAWNHPFLGKEIMGLTFKLFGDHPFGWRISSALFGAGATVAMFILAEVLLGSIPAGLVASFLFMMDGLMFTMSRISTMDIILLFWHLVTFIGIVSFAKTRAWRGGLLASVGAGLSFATKWSGILTLPMVALFVGVPLLRQGDDSIWKRFMKVIYLLVCIPLLIYIAVHVVQWIATGFSWKEVWEVQKQTWMYHAGLKATHPHQSAWWQWPLMLRSLWFYVDYSAWSGGKVGNIYALGNPLIYWSGVAALVALFWVMIRKREFVPTFISVGFLLFWLPWGASPRISFLYHFMPAAVFVLLGLTYWLHRAWDVSYLRRWAYIYIGIAFVLFCVFYPIYTGILIPKEYFNALMWLPGWR